MITCHETCYIDNGHELACLCLQADPGRAGVAYDKEFIVCSLDLLSGLAEGLGSSIESLVRPTVFLLPISYIYSKSFILYRKSYLGGTLYLYLVFYRFQEVI